jgi:hypothetical protein
MLAVGDLLRASRDLVLNRMTSWAGRRAPLPPRRGASLCILDGGHLLWCLARPGVALLNLPAFGTAPRGEREDWVARSYFGG